MLQVGLPAIAAAVVAMLVLYPIDPRPDWVDVFIESMYVVGGAAAAWAAHRAAAPVMLAGALTITGSLAIELSDEFVVESAFAGAWITAATAAAGLMIVAVGLVALSNRERLGWQHLASSEERFRLLFDLTPIPLALCDASGAFLAVNSALERAAGHPRGALIGQKPSAVNLFEDPDVGRIIMNRLARDREGPVRQTARMRSRVGLVRTVNIVAERIMLADGPAVIAAAYDVTDQSILLREMERYQGQLEVAAMKDEFIATMGHQLIAPLATVLSTALDLADGSKTTLSTGPRQAVNVIVDRARHLHDTITAILELSKLDAGRAQIEHQSMPVEQVCEAAWATVNDEIQRKWQDAQLTIARGVGQVYTDRQRVQQMLGALLDNAVKFTPAGGRLGLDVTRDAARGTVIFTVWDSGPGIAEADRGRVFQPFVQLQPALDSARGAGLGLALVRRTARALGGDISLESSGAGCRFVLWLPVHAPASDPHAPAAAAESR